MTLNLKALDGASAPSFSDLTRHLIWAPGYHDVEEGFSSASSAAEGIVIHETSAWPAVPEGLGFRKSVPTATDNTAADQKPPFPQQILYELLDARAGRLVRGYLAVGQSLPAAHVLCCAFAADSSRWIDRHASLGGSMATTQGASLCVPARHFWRQATTCGPFEFLVVIGFLFETFVVEWLESWGAPSCPAWNAYRASLGRNVLHFILDQDPSNRPFVQSWLDQATARCADLFDCADEALLAVMPDAARNERAHIREPFRALSASFAELAPYGINPPARPSMRLRD